MFPFVFLCLATVVTAKIKINDYCTNPRNTPCYYGCSRSKKCGETGEGFKTFTNEERLLVLQMHNQIRNDVASGKYVSNFLLEASNMKVLSYDKETEFIAACYIKQCLYKHDKVRQTLDKTNLGQNMYTITVSSPMVMKAKFLENAIFSWFDQKAHLTINNTEHMYKKFNLINKPERTFELTQLIWGETYELGCAKMRNVKKKNWYSYDLFCNYKPRGNVKGSQLYIPGYVNCGQVNDLYPKLCGNIRPSTVDTFEPPLDLDYASKIECKVILLFLTLYMIILNY